jgi:FdhD protein
MVQKTAAMSAPVMVAVSAPTALAVRMAEAAGITLVAVARSDGFEIFTHPERVVDTAMTLPGDAAIIARDDNTPTKTSMREPVHVG